MKSRGILLLTILFFAAGTAPGQSVDAFSLFESDSFINVRLETDLKYLVKNKYEEEYQPATLTFLDSEDAVSYQVKVKSRGNRRKEVCYFPPIRVKFSKKEFRYHKLKWVIPCRDNEGYEQILLKEYLCYKFYEQLTDIAFRTALMRVEFVDTGRDSETFTRYAFVLEPIDQIAEDRGGREYDPKVLRERILDPDRLALYTYFQYMIANTDWHVANSHNIKAITDTVTRSVAIIPYDFDYSGFVGTVYATPHESIPVKEVTERYNKGKCISKELNAKYRLFFLEKREELLRMCLDFPYFSERTAKLSTAYLEEFFDMLENEGRTRTIFTRNCRTE